MTTGQSASLGLQAEAKRDKIHTASKAPLHGDGDAPALGPAFFNVTASFNRVPVVARDMHATLESLDIHHLRTLTALLGECSITAAARKSGLAQPSVSRMLARMRKVFDDPLLVRSGSKMVLTERGEDLRSPLHEILGQVSRMSANAAFAPRAAEHTFRIACTDCLPTSFVPRLIAAVTGAGSGLDIRIKMADSGFDIAPALEAGELDLVIDNTSNHRADLRISPLYDDEIVCLLSARHPAAGLERLTLARYLSLQHLSPHTNARWERGPIDGVLAGIGYRRRIAATVPEFNLVPHVLLETNLVFTTGRRFAQPHTEHLPLVIVGAPTEFKSMRFRQIWHDRNRSSPSHRWLRQQVLKVSTNLC